MTPDPVIPLPWAGRRPFLVLALCLAPLTGTAEDGTAPAAPGPSVAADIASVLPAYRPPAAEPKPAAPADAREADKPRNQIPRLPVELMRKFVVREHRLPAYRMIDWYTRDALVQMSFKEHPGLRLGNLLNLNAPAAYEKMVREQLGIDRQDLTDTTIAMAAVGDPTEAAAMQDAIIDESFEAAGGAGGPVGIR